MKNVQVYLHPTEETPLEVKGWKVIDEGASITIHLDGKAIVIELEDKKRLQVFNTAANGDFLDRVQKVKLDI